MSCVGTRDPHGNPDNHDELTEGSILTLFRYLRPDKVYLLATPELDDEAAQTRDWMRNAGIAPGNITVNELTPDNPALVNDVLPNLFEQLRQIVEEAPKDAELHIGTSSGTPQMAQAWMILKTVETFSHVRLWQILAPRTHSDQRVAEISLDDFTWRSALNEVYRAIEHHLYERAARAMHAYASQATHPEKRRICEYLGGILAAWNHVDRLEFAEARRKLENLGTPSSLHGQNATDMTELLNKQRIALKRSNSIERSIYVYHAAQRRMNREDLIGSFAFSRSAYESALETYMRRNGYSAPDLQSDDLSGLSKREKDLIGKNDTKFADFVKAVGGERVIDKVRTHRNNVFHGNIDPDREVVKLSLKVTQSAMVYLGDCSEEQLRDHPFAPGIERKTIEAVLKERLQEL